jgi:cyclopropane-fatty-acyl-phospholipid synthase
VFRLLRACSVGTLDVQLPDGSQARFGSGQAPARARCACTTGACAARRCKSGDIGFAESYIDGDWSTPDLARCCSCSSPTATPGVGGLRHLVGLAAHRIKHLLNRNSRQRQPQEHPRPLRPGQPFYRCGWTRR